MTEKKKKYHFEARVRKIFSVSYIKFRRYIVKKIDGELNFIQSKQLLKLINNQFYKKMSNINKIDEI